MQLTRRTQREVRFTSSILTIAWRLRKKHEGILQIAPALGVLFLVWEWRWYGQLYSSQLEVSFPPRKFYGCKILVFLHFFLLPPSVVLLQIFLAIALPLELPSNSAYLAYNFEANYALPNYTQTELQYPPLLSREVSRKMVYDVLELKLKKWVVSNA